MTAEEQTMRLGGGTIEREPRAAARVVADRRALSRIGGALYLTIIAIGAFGELGIRSRIVVREMPRPRPRTC